MQTKLMHMATAGLACLPLLLTGCGEMNVKKYIPFAGDTPQERSRTPANATEYQCAAGKRFYVRTLEGGAAVWLILPEREVRLEKLGAEAGVRYSNGIAVLDINGKEASLKDGTAISLVGCKAAGSP
jgi:membrane-bound inhibitor of C-type lysozyme